MKVKDFYLITLCLCMSLCIASQAQAAGTYHGGDGTADNPYQILTAAHLMELGEHTEDYDDHFILLADIDMDPDIPGNKTWEKAVIAPSNSSGETFDGFPFTGTFDGDGHRIKNLTFEDPYSSFLGLFGISGFDGTIRNLGVENTVIIAYQFDSKFVGYLVGHNDGTIINCHATGKRNVDGGYYSYYRPYCVGSLAGRNTGFIFDCYSAGNIIGGRLAGGLVGHNQNGYIHLSRSNCTLIDCRNEVGGLVGWNEGPSLISYCYATGSIQDCAGDVGGLVGKCRGDSAGQEAVINRCYATGSVDTGSGLVSDAYSYAIIKNCFAVGTVNQSGLIGNLYHYYSSAINCFWDTETSGTTSSDGGTGLNTEQMKQQQTFVEAGWDFDSTWQIIEGRTYPYFQWQDDPLEHLCQDSKPFPVGDLNSDCIVNLEDFTMFCEHWLEDIRR